MEYVDNAIKMQGHSGKEGKDTALWDKAGDTTKTSAKFPRSAMVPYAMVEWPVKENRTHNELILWREKQEKDYPKFQKYDWKLVNKFVIAAGQVDVSDKNSSMMALDVDPVTATYEGFWNWVEHRLDATLGEKSPIIAPAMAGPPQMTAEFLKDMTKILGTSIVALQYQYPQQQQPGATQN